MIKNFFNSNSNRLNPKYLEVFDYIFLEFSPRISLKIFPNIIIKILFLKVFAQKNFKI